MVVARIKQYIDFKQINIARFEAEIGMSNNSFRKSLLNKGTIGADKLENILNKFPDINAEWLLTGKGTMLKSATIAHESETTRLRSRNDLLEKQINTLIETIDVLTATNKKLQA
jgi:hypothetical protein